MILLTITLFSILMLPILFHISNKVLAHKINKLFLSGKCGAVRIRFSAYLAISAVIVPFTLLGLAKSVSDASYPITRDVKFVPSHLFVLLVPFVILFVYLAFASNEPFFVVATEEASEYVYYQTYGQNFKFFVLLFKHYVFKLSAFTDPVVGPLNRFLFLYRIEPDLSLTPLAKETLVEMTKLSFLLSATVGHKNKEAVVSNYFAEEGPFHYITFLHKSLNMDTFKALNGPVGEKAMKSLKRQTWNTHLELKGVLNQLRILEEKTAHNEKVAADIALLNELNDPFSKLPPVRGTLHTNSEPRKSSLSDPQLEWWRDM